MPTWAYEARTREGTLTKGVLQGPSRQAALAELDRLGLAPVRIQETVIRERGVSSAAVASTMRQLGDLLRAGVPLLRALRLLGRGKANPRLATIWNEVADAVADGTTLGDAMARHPAAFNDVQTAMVRAGEKGGFLDDVLMHLGELLEAQAAMRAKVVGSMIYPALLVFTGVAAIVYALVAFVPKFQPFFDRIEVPAATELLLGLSDFTVRFWPWLAVLLIAAIVGVVVARSQPGPRRWMHAKVVRLPMVGTLLLDLAVARTTQVLAALLANGVGLLRALDISTSTSGHPALEDALKSAREAVQSGQRLSASLGESAVMSEDVVEMIDVAETANTLPKVLGDIAEVTRKRVEHRLQLFLRLLEPALLLMVAGMVVFIFAALVLPMMRMSSAMQ